MKIRTQFYTTLLLFGGLMAAIAVSAIVTNEQVEKASRQENIAHAIAQGASELSFLANDYVIYRESQQLERWQARYASFSSDVASLQIDEPEQQALVRNIQENTYRLKEVFDSVVSLIGSESQPGDPDLLPVSWSRLAVQSRSLISDASRLSELTSDQAELLQTTNTIIVAALVCIFIGYFVVNYLATQRRVLKSVAELQAGTAVIGGGNLDFKFQEKRNDEIGDLAHAFNRMTSDLKAATEEVLAERRRFYSVLETLPAYVVLLDKEYHMPFANRFFRERFGESHGKRCFEYLFKKNAPCDGCETYKVMQTKMPHRWEWLGPDGRNYDIYDYPFKDTDGSLMILEMGIDITERKQAEQSLRLEQARLDTLLRLSHMSEAPIDEMAGFILEHGIALTQSKIGFVGFLSEDESVYTLHAVSKDVVKECQVQGDPLQWHVSGAGIWADAIRQRRTLIINDYNKPYPNKKGLPPGHPPVNRLMVVPLFDGERIVAVAGVGNKDSDYDESDERQVNLLLGGMWNHVQRNRAREAVKEAYDKLEQRVAQRTAELRETRDYLENLFNYANAPIIVWDPEFKITRFNHAFENLTGRTADEVLGQQLDILFPEESREESMRHIRRAVAGERWEVVEIPIIHRDGTVRILLWNSATLYAADGRTAVATIAQGQDITRRKRAEEELKQRTVELEASNQELEAFSYSVSHDLRAPLRSLEGFSSALLEDYAGALDEQGKQYLSYIQESSDLMGRLIDDLLKLSRVTRSDMNRERVDLSEMARKIIADLKKAEPDRKVKLDIAPDITAYGDRNLLRLVLENLLVNAWKFSGKTDSPHIEMGVTVSNGRRTYFVRDNGVGFDMRYADKLFKPFQRLHKSSDFAGTGIGLATVQRIIRRHSGEVWAESRPGEGATFYFTLGW